MATPAACENTGPWSGLLLSDNTYRSPVCRLIRTMWPELKSATMMFPSGSSPIALGLLKKTAPSPALPFSSALTAPVAIVSDFSGDPLVSDSVSIHPINRASANTETDTQAQPRGFCLVPFKIFIIIPRMLSLSILFAALRIIYAHFCNCANVCINF